MIHSQGGAWDTTQSREEGVSLDPMGEQSGIGQISYHTSLSLESGEGGPIYSSWGEGIQHEATQGGIDPAEPVVPLLAGGSTARAVVPLRSGSTARLRTFSRTFLRGFAR